MSNEGSEVQPMNIYAPMTVFASVVTEVSDVQFWNTKLPATLSPLKSMLSSALQPRKA